MHKHNDCSHELKFCNQCDVVYCNKCRKEWKFKPININWPTIYPIQSEPYEPTIIWGGTTRECWINSHQH